MPDETTRLDRATAEPSGRVDLLSAMVAIATMAAVIGAMFVFFSVSSLRACAPGENSIACEPATGREFMVVPVVICAMVVVVAFAVVFVANRRGRSKTVA